METSRSWLGWVWLVLSNLVIFALLGWGLFSWLRRSVDPARLVFRWVVSAVVVIGAFSFIAMMGGMSSGGGPGDYGVAILIAGTAAACGLVLAMLWGESIASSFASVITNSIDGGRVEVAPPALYSRALALRKKGDPEGAITVIREELEKHPGDFEGLMLLAEIRAEDCHDMESARAWIHEIVIREELGTVSRSFALNRLADWELKRANDPVAARKAVEKIVALMPESMEAQFARQRLAHLDGTVKMLERKEQGPLTLPTEELPLGLRGASAKVKEEEADPLDQVRLLVAQLESHPHDFEARERLAMVYADKLGRADLAADQLEQLIREPNLPASRIAYWLNLLADVHVQYDGNLAAGRAALERIIARNPTGPAAAVARNRLLYLKLEARKNEKSQAVPLGSYDQDLGLKTTEPVAARFASPIRPPTRCP